jgi:hypothetical protein
MTSSNNDDCAKMLFLIMHQKEIYLSKKKASHIDE